MLRQSPRSVRQNMNGPDATGLDGIEPATNAAAHRRQRAHRAWRAGARPWSSSFLVRSRRCRKLALPFQDSRPCRRGFGLRHVARRLQCEMESAVCARGSLGVSAVRASAAAMDGSKRPRVAQGADEAVVRLKVTSVGLNCRAKCRCGLIGAAFGEQVKPSLA